MTVLTATGDLMFNYAVARQMRERQDPLWPLSSVADAIQEGDVLFGNLESPPFREYVSKEEAASRFFGPPETVRVIKEVGYQIVNLAHNHIYDMGAEGVEYALAELRAHELPYIGVGRSADEAATPAVLKGVDGSKIGFLGYTTASNVVDPRNTYVACFPKTDRVVADVRSLRSSVDVVVVSCHTGAMLNPYPSPETRRLARAAIDSGASVFLGHHPHIPQGWERIGHGIALYSLGDFVAPFHPKWGRQAFFARLRLERGQDVSQEIVPCTIDSDSQTRLAEGSLHEKIQCYLQELSQSIEKGSSDELHFTVQGKQFFRRYVASWRIELQRGGPRVFLNKIRHLRPYHFKLLMRAITNLMRWK